jgi:small neutral amino acid transporter SnatA (MarC family)
VLLGILGALAVVGIVMFAAERLSRFIPESLIQFLTRVFGLLLSAIAVQLVVNGVRGIVQGS